MIFSAFISAAVVAERLCEQMKLTPGEMLTYLRSRGCKIGAVTMGSRGMLWYDETKTERFLPALSIPDDKVIDTNGAGDIFHGAYMYSYLRRSGRRLGTALQIRARSVVLRDPASRQRGEPADARPNQRDRGTVRRPAAEPGRA